MSKQIIEVNGINFISESERKGSAKSLFWPWAAANVSFLALSYGSFFLGFGISFWQATTAAIIGTLGSFSLVAISSLAGKRANAPTMTLSRAAFVVVDSHPSPQTMASSSLEQMSKVQQGEENKVEEIIGCKTASQYRKELAENKTVRGELTPEQRALRERMRTPRPSGQTLPKSRLTLQPSRRA